MRLQASGSQKQHQNAGMVPEHFLGKAVLKMSLQELQQFVQEQLAENPALVMEDDSRCPLCGCVLVGGVCPGCGSESFSGEEERSADGDDWDDGLWTSPGHSDDESCEPLAFVAAPMSLTEHLKEQIHVSLQGDNGRIAEFLIDCLDEDGYLREPLVDIAGRFKVSVPQLEEVLRSVQCLEPAGVGARDLRECMLLQIAQLDLDSEEKRLAEIIVRDHWEAVSRMKFDRLAERLDIDIECLTDALTFMREHLTPHPACGFRDPWEKLAPRKESKHVPDVLVRQVEDGLSAEILDPVTGQAVVDEMYSGLYADIMRKRSGCSDSERAHIRECVQSARVLIESLEFRKSTLRRVADEIVRRQSEFITQGAAHLKPLTRKELARKLGVHESTVCRATTDKTIQLPSGEVISFDIFFDSALPVKELVRKLAADRPNGRAMSDGEIAEKLKSLGFEIARRTVAKYRSQLRVLPLEYRLAA